MDFILTNDGAAVMTEAASGKDLVLTRAESGTGYSSAPATLSTVSGKQQDLDIEEVIFENQETRITVFLSNRLLDTGYNLRQIGIYGKIAGSDQDVLMIVGQQYSGEPIHPISDGEEECRYNVLMKVSGTSSITVEGGSGSLATKQELLLHTENKKNPHNVTAEQVGLGNVPNVKTDDQTPTVEMASDRANIEKGDTFKIIVGKMMKWFADLKTGAFSSVANNLLTTLAGSVLDARQGKVLKENIDTVDEKVTEIYSDLEWKLHKSVTGQEEITLPSDYRELYIVISPFDPEVFMTYVIKGALSDSPKRFHLGSCTFYSQDSKAWAWSVDFLLSKTKFKLGDVTNNPGSGSYDRYYTSTVCTIYYK